MKVTKETIIADLVQHSPEAAHVLMKKGLHCIGCRLSMMETIEQGAKAHGLSDKEIEKLVHEINLFLELQQKD